MNRLRVLATGFSVFPRAPFNPTEVLMGMLAQSPPDLGPDAELITRVLPVEYAAAPEALRDIGAAFQADIAVHFGLADTARGFRLETTARNRSSLVMPDAAGRTPDHASVCAGPATLASTLPIAEIRGALRDADLPVQMSANAGAYLCNHLFYLSRSGTVAGFAPAMSGFVHVPFLEDQLEHLPEQRARSLPSLTRDQLLDGAKIILRTCVQEATGLRQI